MANRFDPNEIADRRIRQFAFDCIAAGSTPEDVLRAAGINRSAWFRWRTGKFSPTLRTWDRAQEALAVVRRASANAAADQRGEAAA